MLTLTELVCMKWQRLLRGCHSEQLGWQDLLLLAYAAVWNIVLSANRICEKYTTLTQSCRLAECGRNAPHCMPQFHKLTEFVKCMPHCMTYSCQLTQFKVVPHWMTQSCWLTKLTNVPQCIHVSVVPADRQDKGMRHCMTLVLLTEFDQDQQGAGIAC